MKQREDKLSEQSGVNSPSVMIWWVYFLIILNNFCFKSKVVDFPDDYFLPPKDVMDDFGADPIEADERMIFRDLRNFEILCLGMWKLLEDSLPPIMPPTPNLDREFPTSTGTEINFELEIFKLAFLLLRFWYSDTPE